MKTQDSFSIDSDIRAKKSESGVWYLSHPDKTGKIIQYSSGIRGNRKEIKTYVKKAGIPDIVALAKTGNLTRDALARALGIHNVSLNDAMMQWQQWLEDIGESNTTQAGYLSQYKQWVAMLGISDTETRTIDLGFKDLDQFVNPGNSELKLASRRFRMAFLQSLFRFFSAKGFIIENPAKLLKINMNKMHHALKETKQVESFSDEDIAKVLAYFRDRIAKIESDIARVDKTYSGQRKANRKAALAEREQRLRFMFAATIISYETGLRLSDVAQLEWACIGKDSITVWTDKRDARVEIPFTALNEELLREAIITVKYTDLDYMFPEQREDLNDGGKRSKLSCYYGRELSKAGVYNKSFHGLRHTRIRRWKEQGMSLEDIGKLVAHKNTKTTEGYL